ncbi:MAG TPA: SpoIID/LytB domain-containing protein [Chloroflexota bacterium]|nr:SpoIID/LytB domain-containing protein [Chloroflexota bacterium]
MKSHSTLRSFLATLATLAATLGTLIAPLGARAAAAPLTELFPQTGHSVSFGFKQFFDSRGGVQIFGYPTTEEIKENGWTVQYFQRARFEYHPEFAGTPYEVELGLLGDLTAPHPFPKATATGQGRFYPQTSHNLSGPFLTFFNAHGGLDIFGYPTSEPFAMNGFTVQYFQRARMELHGSQVELGLLGDEYRAKLAGQGGAPPAGGQPSIRVAIYGSGDAPGAPANTVNIGADGPFTVANTAGASLLSGNAGQTLTISASNPSSYTLALNGKTVTSSSPVRVSPLGSTLLKELNLPAWEDDFRGVLEADYSTQSNKLWVVNELGMEDYVKGIGEETEGDPPEAYKAFAVAYRGYALSTQQRHKADPNWKEPFDLGSSSVYVAPYTGANQIYTGEHRETLGPDLTQGEQATWGQVVTYNGKVAVTPYFSHSDGHTRGWQQVWGGTAHPWLISVADPDSNGEALLGHGVGMPLQSTIKRAAAGWTYQHILQYFYTGVQITKLY